MKILLKAAVIVLLHAVILSANADQDHKHSKGCKHKKPDTNVAVQMEENQSTIEKNAKEKMIKLVLEKKIPKSWEDAVLLKTVKTKNNTNDWVVSFGNTNIKNRSKQTLYIFVSVYGKVMGVNYSGK